MALVGATGLRSQGNVNSRYTVERVDISDNGMSRISRTLQEDLTRLIGEKLDPQKLDQLARRVKKELNARFVQQKLVRGTQPEQVIVLLDVKGRRHPTNFDIKIPKAVYSSKQGVSIEAESSVKVASNWFKLGLVSDGDELVERFTGLRAGYDRPSLGTDRVGLAFNFASFHQKWNPDTELALAERPDVPGVYRTRQEFAPTVSFVIAEPLTLSVGTSFQRFETQFPAARTESANALMTTLRLSERFADSRGDNHEVDAGYSLRAATKVLGSDFVYARHQVDARYSFKRDEHTISAKFLLGRLSGTAPLFDRFVLGNTRTLRGWNKFEVDPLGGTSVTHGSLEYAYHWVQFFYDVGVLRDRVRDPGTKHSLGVGVRSKSGMFLAMAFPVRSGQAAPIIMAGTEF